MGCSSSGVVDLCCEKARLKIAPTNISFGELVNGEAVPFERVRLTNTGFTEIVINSVEIFGNFSLEHDVPPVMKPGQEATLKVGFYPGRNGEIRGAVAIDAASLGVQLIGLTGSASGYDVTELPTVIQQVLSAETLEAMLQEMGFSNFFQTLLGSGDGATIRAAIGAGVGDMFKADNLSGLANNTTARSNLGVAIGTNVQAYDADLTLIAALATTAYGRAFLVAADAADAQAHIKLVLLADQATYDAIALKDADTYYFIPE